MLAETISFYSSWGYSIWYTTCECDSHHCECHLASRLPQVLLLHCVPLHPRWFHQCQPTCWQWHFPHSDLPPTSTTYRIEVEAVRKGDGADGQRAKVTAKFPTATASEEWIHSIALALQNSCVCVRCNCSMYAYVSFRMRENATATGVHLQWGREGTQRGICPPCYFLPHPSPHHLLESC